MYTVTVTDANGCSIVGTTTVTQPAVLTISGVQVDPAPNNKYKLTVTATGGTAPYQYRRVPGSAAYQTSNVFNNVPTGTYQIFVRDNKLCETSMTISVPGTAGRPGGAPDDLQTEQPVSERADIIPNLVKVYPNPATDEVNIRIGRSFREATMHILDAQGRLVLEQPVPPETEGLSLQIGAWKAGLYFIQLSIDGERIVQKLQVAGR
jgi:hypothetical protein